MSLSASLHDFKYPEFTFQRNLPFKHLLIYLKDRVIQTVTEERDHPATGSLPKWLQQLGAEPGKIQEAEFLQGWQKPK